LAPTPAYLKVEGYELCLEIYQVGASALSEYCKPQEKPGKCPDTAWNQLNRVFVGIGCKSVSKSNVKVGSPVYLSVPQFRNCLSDHPAPTGTYSELCLPPIKPDSCPEKSWESLQDPEIFTGVKCALYRTDLPKFLQIKAYQDCLGVTDNQDLNRKTWCLPEEKPFTCPSDSWTQIQDKFDGISCSGSSSEESSEESSEKSGAVQFTENFYSRIYGGLTEEQNLPGVLPPTYLSVSGFEDCLGIDQSSISHTTRCLPKSKPENCIEESWSEILADFDGLNCPKVQESAKIKHILDHQKCIKRRIDQPANCVTLTPEDDCIPETHAEILNAVFAEGPKSSAIIFPGIERNSKLG